MKMLEKSNNPREIAILVKSLSECRKNLFACYQISEKFIDDKKEDKEKEIVLVYTFEEAKDW